MSNTGNNAERPTRPGYLSGKEGILAVGCIRESGWRKRNDVRFVGDNPEIKILLQSCYLSLTVAKSSPCNLGDRFKASRPCQHEYYRSIPENSYLVHGNYIGIINNMVSSYSSCS